MRGVEGDGAAQETGGGWAFFVGEHLGVGQAGGVIDADVDEFPALWRAATASSAVGGLAGALSCDAVAGSGDDAELFDVVDELARVPALVAVGRLGRLKAAELAQADALE